MVVMLSLGETRAGDFFAADHLESGQIAAVTLESTSDFYGASEYDASGYAVAPRRGFSGARELEFWDFDGADALYDTIRATDDVADIARHSGIPQFQVQRVKDHLFFNTHQLDDGIRRFDADPLIGNAWKRFQGGTHTPADIQLFQHELFEAKFEGIFRTNYRTAHDAANRAGRPSGL